MPSQPEKMKEDEKHESYAKLIYKALMGAEGYQMALKDIYQWFMAYTDKGKGPSCKGWQNSIRHNLSMNGAFKKVEQGPPSKGDFVWVLEPSAIAQGVKSTTRYMRTPPLTTRKIARKPALQRQVSGRKGGQQAASKRRRKGGQTTSKRPKKGMNVAKDERMRREKFAHHIASFNGVYVW